VNIEFDDLNLSAGNERGGAGGGSRDRDLNTNEAGVICMCGMTHSSGSGHICRVTYSYLGHDPFIRGTCFNRIWDTTRLPTRHAPRIFVA